MSENLFVSLADCHHGDMTVDDILANDGFCCFHATGSIKQLRGAAKPNRLRNTQVSVWRAMSLLTRCNRIQKLGVWGKSDLSGFKRNNLSKAWKDGFPDFGIYRKFDFIREQLRHKRRLRYQRGTFFFLMLLSWVGGYTGGHRGGKQLAHCCAIFLFIWWVAQLDFI